jgi:hypothetical protein
VGAVIRLDGHGGWAEELGDPVLPEALGIWSGAPSPAAT